ncbi:hypothetical protein E1178_06695 [Roseibium hamelinense]|nr:hypothetical protein [Roseibium hamelinense]
MPRRRKTDTPPVSPLPSAAAILTVLIAGAVASGLWEIWARAITPLFIGGPLEASALVKSSFGINSSFLAETIHIVTGVIAYPLGYLLVARPLAKYFPISLPWPIVGAGFGVGLWVFAMYVMAHLVAGFPPFLGFGNLALASLYGHVLYGVAVAAIFRLRDADS